jgi:hypothetical protein
MDSTEIGANDVDRRILWLLNWSEHIQSLKAWVDKNLIFEERSWRAFPHHGVLIPKELFRVVQNNITLLLTHLCRENLKPFLKDVFDLIVKRLKLNLARK